MTNGFTEEMNKWLESNLTYKKGVFKVTGNFRAVDYLAVSSKMLKDGTYPPTAEDFKEWCDNVKNEVESVQSGKSEEIFDDIRDWVQSKLNTYNIIFNANGTMSVETDSGIYDKNLDGLIATLKTDLAFYNQHIPKDLDGNPLGCKLDRDLISSCICLIREKQAQQREEAVRKKLKFDPNSKIDIDVWIKGIFDIYCVDYMNAPWNIEMFKHMLYLIKRKIFNRTEKEMPIFFVIYSNRQKVGKTTFFEKLSQPFSWAYSKNGNLSSLLTATDAKAMIGGKYLIDFQELALSKSLQNNSGDLDAGAMAKIKAALTTETLDGREMYTTVNDVRRQSAVFVSSSNIHIYDVINDAGGMRRFWEFKFNVDAKKDPTFYIAADEYWEDLIEVYRAIDENDPKGFYCSTNKYWSEMEETQSKYASMDAISNFCLHKNWEISMDGPQENYEQMKLTKFLSAFNRYQTTNGDRPWKRWSVKNLLSQKDIIPVMIDINGVKEDILYVKQSQDGETK
jgi:hypothetical protein